MWTLIYQPTTFLNIYNRISYIYKTVKLSVFGICDETSTKLCFASQGTLLCNLKWKISHIFEIYLKNSLSKHCVIYEGKVICEVLMTGGIVLSIYTI